MKLKLKHLAPYLPYRLKVEVDESKQIFELYGLNKNYAELLKLNENRELIADFIYKEFKPILRPLFDLQKGFHKDFDEVLFDENNYVFTDEEGMKATPSIELFIGDGCNNTIIFDGVVEIYNLLMKHHFDYFRLIEKGLAISIHDVAQAGI